jgi:hypothetical protein
MVITMYFTSAAAAQAQGLCADEEMDERDAAARGKPSRLCSRGPRQDVESLARSGIRQPAIQCNERERS